MNRLSYPSSKRSAKARPANQWNYREEDDEEEEDDDEVELPDSNEDEDEDEDVDYGGYQRSVESNYRNRSSKMRKVEDFNSGYEFRPRGIHSARASHAEWNDHSNYALLDAWGERFLQLGRSSLRSDDWSEVAERVSELTGSEFSVTDCRNRLNDLKNKYKKEKAKLESLGGGGSSKWVYFKKMDLLLTMPPRQQQQCGLACGVDSGEFVFMNPRVYLDHSNALDEMRDSPGNSDSEEDNDDDVGYRKGGRRMRNGDEADDLESYRMLSESIKRVGKIYENIETSKREHMMELERMRMDFQRDLEMQKKEMMETTRAEIERMRQAEAEDVDLEDADGSAHSASE